MRGSGVRSSAPLGGPAFSRRLRQTAAPGVEARLRSIGRLSAAAGERAYLVGGPVRDLLLGRSWRDLDVMVEGDAVRLAERVAAEGGGSVRRFRQFGTARVEVVDGPDLDLASARRERYPAPAALPQVERGTLLEDLRRRDFGVNAMAVALDPGRFGRLIDPLDGRSDLAARYLRVLHERSFVDDPTRAFRAARLAARLRFRIETRTARWMREALARGVFDGLSLTRRRRELGKTLDEEEPARALARLERMGLLRSIDPALRWDPPLAVRMRRLVRSLAGLCAGGTVDTAERRDTLLALLLQAATASRRRAALLRLVPGGAEREAVVRAWRRAPRVVAALERRRGAGDLDIWKFCRDQGRRTLLLALALAGPSERRAIVDYLTRIAPLPIEVNGHDLLRSGIARGPGVAVGLRAAKAAKLRDGATRTGQLAAARRAALRVGGRGKPRRRARRA